MLSSYFFSAPLQPSSASQNCPSPCLFPHSRGPLQLIFFSSFSYSQDPIILHLLISVPCTLRGMYENASHHLTSLFCLFLVKDFLFVTQKCAAASATPRFLFLFQQTFSRHPDLIRSKPFQIQASFDPLPCAHDIQISASHPCSVSTVSLFQLQLSHE